MTQCHLTAKDFNYLQSLLASKDFGEPFLHLLRRKLGSANLLLDHTIDHRIATLDSRVAFSVGGGFTEERVLTRDEKGATTNHALPVTTLRGLALLGLRENDVVSLLKPGGVVEPIRLLKVAYQPEAAKRGNVTGTVVQFQPRWKKSMGTVSNDDPGPGAA